MVESVNRRADERITDAQPSARVPSYKLSESLRIRRTKNTIQNYRVKLDKLKSKPGHPKIIVLLFYQNEYNTIHIKKKVSMIRKYHNHILQTKPWHVRKSHGKCTVTRYM